MGTSVTNSPMTPPSLIINANQVANFTQIQHNHKTVLRRNGHFLQREWYWGISLQIFTFKTLKIASYYKQLSAMPQKTGNNTMLYIIFQYDWELVLIHRILIGFDRSDTGNHVKIWCFGWFYPWLFFKRIL